MSSSTSTDTMEKPGFSAIRSRTALERLEKELYLKYKRLRAIVAAGLPSKYTAEELDHWERKELELLKARCTFGDLSQSTPFVTTVLNEPAPDALVLPPITHECELRDFQLTARAKMLTNILHLKQTAIMLQAGVGTGKTFMCGSIFHAFKEINWSRPGVDRTVAVHAPMIWVTKAQIVTKTQRDLKSAFGLTEEDCLVTSYDQLRATFGQWFFKSKTIVKDGEPVIVWEPRRGQLPYVILWDEAHSLKNETSLQSTLAQSLNNLHKDERPLQIFMSATIGTRLRDFKCFSVAAGYCTNETWKSWICALARDGDPNLRSKSAMKRYMATIEDHVVRVPAINGKYRAHNRVLPIQFLTLEDKRHAEQALERYMEKKQNLKEHLPGERFMQLVAFNEFRRETEPLRAPILAKLMREAVDTGHSAVCAVSFKVSAMRAIKHLIAHHGVKREEISVVWGGDELDGAKNMTQQEINDALHKIIKGETVPARVLKQIQRQAYPTTDINTEFEDVDLGDLKFGKQDQKARQIEIDKFQTGRTRYMFFTWASGGVGLSLHDSDDHFKVTLKHLYQLHHTDPDGRNYWLHKRTGEIHRSYPRRAYLGPTFSGQDFVQGLGRAHRSIFSFSDTYQDVLFFEDSVERDVMEIVSQNLRCLSEAVKSAESWQDTIMKGGRSTKSAVKPLDTSYATVDDAAAIEADTEEETDEEPEVD